MTVKVVWQIQGAATAAAAAAAAATALNGNVAARVAL
jgi:hypothetical protein